MLNNKMQIVATLPDIVIYELFTIQGQFELYKDKSFDYIISNAIMEFYSNHCPDHIEEYI